VAAARLFADVGYDKTTMTDIARAAGLDQSSLYYWFRRKELILQATLSVNRLPVEFLERISAEEGSPVLKLYRLLRFDIYQLCSSPFDINEVERQAERQPDMFKSYWQDNQELFEGGQPARWQLPGGPLPPAGRRVGEVRRGHGLSFPRRGER
jgi:AcrR family transcriptional regulator